MPADTPPSAADGTQQEQVGSTAQAQALAALAEAGPPLNVQQLNVRVVAIADALGVLPDRARVLISSVIVAQMLPSGTVVKGGIGVKMRLGEVGTRATPDVDVVAVDRDGFLDRLNQRLRVGWGTVPPSKGALRKDADAPRRLAFDGQARRKKTAARPDGVPEHYLMDPYFVTLNFLGSSWARVQLEVAHDEISGTEHAELGSVAEPISAIGTAMGFGQLAAVPLISAEQQIAQKIHAATQPGSGRAHDLVDLQLLWGIALAEPGADLTLASQMCRRTFDFRQTHPWPPVVDMPDELELAYQKARDEVGAGPQGLATAGVVIAATLPEALAWLRARVAELAD